MTDFLTVKETADYLRISSRTVYRLIESGEVHAVRIGKQWRVPQHTLPEGIMFGGRPVTVPRSLPDASIERIRMIREAASANLAK